MALCLLRSSQSRYLAPEIMKSHLSPAAWLGNDVNRSGCFGNGFSLP